MSDAGETAVAPLTGGHARRMDSIYALQRHIYDSTRKYYLLGRDRLIAELDVPSGGSVLEIGCGTARNLILAGERYGTAKLYGLDISAEMLKTARTRVADKPLVHRMSLMQGDASRFDAMALFGRQGFDRVFCSYTLSMIPDWKGAIAMAVRALKPGGSVHIVDFGQQDRLPAAFRAALQQWLAAFHVTPRSELFDVCEDLAREHGLACRTQSLYRDYARSVVLSGRV